MSRHLSYASALCAGLALFACVGAGCDDGRDGYYYGGGYGPGYGAPRSRAGAIRFEWSLEGAANGVAGAGSTDAAVASDEDAGAAGASADAGSAAASGPTSAACDAIGATQFQALLYNQGTIVNAFQARCSASPESFRVQSNDYTVTATLAGDDGAPVTRTEVIQ